MALTVTLAGAAQRHALVQSHVVAHNGGFADDHAGGVIDEQAAGPRKRRGECQRR